MQLSVATFQTSYVVFADTVQQYVASFVAPWFQREVLMDAVHDCHTDCPSYSLWNCQAKTCFRLRGGKEPLGDFDMQRSSVSLQGGGCCIFAV